MMTKSKNEQLIFSAETLCTSIENYNDTYQMDVTDDQYFGYPTEPILNIENALLSKTSKAIAYFSMEFGLAPSIYNSFELKKAMNVKNQFFTHEVFSNNWLCDYLFKINIDKQLDIPIYGGGLGVLAGDAMKSAADCGLPLMGIGIMWNKGYFKQRFWYKHGQIPEELTWDPHSYPGLIPLKNRVIIETKEGPLSLRLWKYYVYSHDQSSACPLILLDSNVEENKESYRKLTNELYRSDDVWWRIFQRAILGIGGMKALGELNYHIDVHHLNEGHAAFAIVEKYMQLGNNESWDDYHRSFAYTCHTPVMAGHDRFYVGDVYNILPDEYADVTKKLGTDEDNDSDINLTYLCLRNCAHVNAVALKHREIMNIQFPRYSPKIKAITNGIHIHTWVSDSFKRLFDQYAEAFENWREKPEVLSQATTLLSDSKFRKDIYNAHRENKSQLIKDLKHWQLSDDVLTIGWARRIVAYKRPGLIFHDINKLLDIANTVGPLQIILAGKAHPNDSMGSDHIEEILNRIDELNDHTDVIKVLILENYDTYFGKLLTSSVDVWLNNPLPPFEASGTSGMKAILNGVLQLSTLDGWVVEAAQDDIGWIFGFKHTGTQLGEEMNLRLDEDADALYVALRATAKLYYQTNNGREIKYDSPWIDKMIHCVSKAAFFNTQRMVSQYNQQMWQNHSDKGES